MAENYLSSILHNIPLAYLFCKVEYDSYQMPIDYTILEVNQAFENLTNIKALDLIQKKGSELTFDSFFALKPHKEKILVGKKKEFDFFISGFTKKLKVQVKQTQKDFFLLFLELAPQQQDFFSSDFFNKQLNPLCIIDFKGNFVSINPAFKKTFFYSFEDLKAKKFFELIPQKEGAVALKVFTKLVQERPKNMILSSFAFISKNQKLFSIRWQFYLKDSLIYIMGEDITEKVLKEEAFNQQEQEYHALFKRFEAIYHNLPVGILVLSKDLKPIGGNDIMYEWFPDLKNTKAHHCSKVFNCPKDNHNNSPHHFCKILAALEKNEVYEIENQIATKDGKKFFRITAIPVLTANEEEIDYIMQIFENITLLKEQALKLQESKNRYEKIFNGSGEAILISRRDTEKIIYANRASQEMFGYEDYELLGLSFKDLHPKDSTNDNHQSFHALKEKDNRYIPFLPCIKKDGTLFYVDLKDATITLDGHVCNIGFFTDVTMQNTYFRLLSNLAQNVPGALFQFRLLPDNTFSFPYAQGRLEEKLGFSLTEITKDPLLVFRRVHPEEQEEFWESIQTSAKNLSVWKKELRFLSEQGTYFWVEGFSTPIKETDGSVVWYGYLQDIQERKEIELEKAALASILENTDSIAVIKDLDNKIMAVNKSFLNILPNSLSKDLIGKTYQEVFKTYLKDNTPAIDFLALEKENFKIHKLLPGQFLSREDIIKLPFGEQKVFETKRFPIYNNNQLSAIAILSNDITKQKKAQEALEALIESEENFRQLAENIKHVFWLRDKENLLYLSPVYELVWEQKVEDALTNPTGFLSVFPEDLNRFPFLTKKDGGLEIFEGEFRIVLPNQKIKWIWARTFPVYQKDGSYLRVAGIAEDITEKREIEKAIMLYNVALEKELIEKKQSLLKAQKVQQNLNTKNLPITHLLDSTAFYLPCEELGGDFFMVQQEGDKVFLILGDCEGHGLEAALDSVLAKAICDRYLNFLALGQTDVFLSLVSQNLSHYFNNEKFMTLAAVVFDSQKGEMVYSLANAETPVLIREGKAQFLPRPEGWHIGFQNDNDLYEKIFFQLQEGDTLLFYSDALREEEGFFKEKAKSRKLEFLNFSSSLGKGIQRDLKNIVKALKEQKVELPLKDDLTLCLFQFKSPFVLQKNYQAKDREKFKATLLKVLEERGFAKGVIQNFKNQYKKFLNLNPDANFDAQIFISFKTIDIQLNKPDSTPLWSFKTQEMLNNAIFDLDFFS